MIVHLILGILSLVGIIVVPVIVLWIPGIVTVCFAGSVAASCWLCEPLDCHG
jgi:hypothetical protein